MTSRTAGLLSVLLAAALAAACSSGEDAAGGGFSGGGGSALSCPVPVGPLAFAVSGRSNSPEPGLPEGGVSWPILPIRSARTSRFWPM